MRRGGEGKQREEGIEQRDEGGIEVRPQKRKERDREEERDFPHFQSGGSGTQSACRRETNQPELLLLARSLSLLSLLSFSRSLVLSFFLKRKEKTPMELPTARNKMEFCERTNSATWWPPEGEG